MLWNIWKKFLKNPPLDNKSNRNAPKSEKKKKKKTKEKKKKEKGKKRKNSLLSKSRVLVTTLESDADLEWGRASTRNQSSALFLYTMSR